MKTNETVTKKPKEKLNVMTTFSYTIGYSASNVIWYMINNYLLLFYTDVVGLAAGAISTIMLISRIWGGINDPVVGAIVDRTHTKWGKFKPYLAIGAPFLAIFNILTFTVWPLEGMAKVVVCLLCYMVLGTGYATVSVAVNSLVNRLSNNPQIKMDIIAIAQVGNSIASTILGACAMTLILYFSKSDVANGTGYFWTTVIFSAISVVMFWICCAGCKEVKDKKEIMQETGEVKAEKVPLKKSLRAVMKNRMLLIVIFNVFIGAAASMTHMSFLSYYLIYCVGAYAYIAPIFTIISLTQMIGSLILPVLTRKLGKVRWLIISMLVNSLSMLILFFVPENSITVVFVLSGLYGLTNAVTSISSSMMCDSIEYGDYMYGVRDDAFAFSMMSLGVKIATALVGAGGVLLLAGVGYVAGAEQTPATLTGISAIVNLLPAILGLIALIPLAFYKLDEKRMEKIRVELEARRAGE